MNTTTLKSLLETAMLGTGNSTSFPGLERDHIPHTDSEAGLLASAAIIGIGEIGGRLPVTLEVNEIPCPPESRPLMSEKAAGLLKRILAGEFDAVFPEFLHLAAEREILAPPEMIPALLGIDKKKLRPLVQAVIGERGRWLVAHNPAWRHALTPAGEGAWETGELDEQVALLEQLRATTPEKARVLVISTWEQDPPEARAAFLETFSVGLSMSDEPFLETCLDDRRKEVREAALKSLVRLPGSRMVERAAARLEPLMRLIKAKVLGGDRLEVSLPENLDAAAKRDGAGGAISNRHWGEKANGLVQMLSVVPPVIWNRKWDRPPVKLIQAALGSEWKEAILLGWALAAERSGDPDWAAALIDATVRKDEARDLYREGGWEGLIRYLPLEKLEALAQAMVIPLIKELDDTHPLLKLLEVYPHPWSAKLARAVIKSVRRQTNNTHWKLMHALPEFGLHIPPELADELSTDWPESMQGWEPWVDKFVAVMKFRKEIMEAL
jgi:hypothetical protein